MTPKRRYSFWIDDEQAAGLKLVKERDHILESEQVRLAIDQWLEQRGVKKTGSRRAATRRLGLTEKA